MSSDDTKSRAEAAGPSVESESRYRTLFEHAPEAIVVFDADTGRFVDLNQNAVRLYGLEREVLLNVGPIDLSPPRQPDGRSSRETAREQIQRALDGLAPAFEWVHQDAQGNEIPCEVRLVRLPAKGRNLIRGSVTDITPAKRADQALRESEARYRGVVEDQTEFIVRWHPGGIRNFVNAAYCRAGYPLDSGDPKILWLGSKRLVPLGEDRAVRRRLHCHGLLHQPVEELAATA